jgi:carbon-monoxide dehydrogenase iron sulfur subunit
VDIYFRCFGDAVKTLIVKVKKIEGHCDTHRVGDCFKLEGGRLSFPEENKHICIYALSSLLPLLPAKQRQIDEPNDWLPKVFEVECPDPKGRVIWEITCEK